MKRVSYTRVELEVLPNDLSALLMEKLYNLS